MPSTRCAARWKSCHFPITMNSELTSDMAREFSRLQAISPPTESTRISIR